MDERILVEHRRDYRLFQELSSLQGAEREARIEALARTEPTRAAALRALIAEVERGEGEMAEEGTTGRLIGGRFRLLRRLGGGGMGEVYLAERDDDVQQQVAVKLVRHELPLSRAQRERQILARLNHPHIASLIDAGLTPSGQAWFAMDYVDGEPITDACDRRGLGLPARARLLAQIAHAVQFAHKNLILHRDLKPSNIFIDAEGTPRLLDFGIARFLDVTDAQETQTVSMTPAYASPEQLRGESAGTASDIYQLGLVLYELTCGIPARKARDAAARAGAPGLPRPDHALMRLAESDRAGAERIARWRGTNLDRLRKTLRGDLARVIAKATADDLHERYQTAQALAEDLERWADDLPVAAHRGSFAYRLSKLVYRHVVATLVIATLGLGLVAVSLVAVDRARIERQQRERAERQQQRAQTLLGFMRDVFHEAEPDNTGGAKLDAGELLQRATQRLDQRADLDAPTRAVLLTEVADVFSALRQQTPAMSAVEQAERTLAPMREDHPSDYLRSVEVLASALTDAGRYEEAVEAVTRALPLADRQSAAEPQWRANLTTIRGSALSQLGRYDDAEGDLRSALSAYEELGVRTGKGIVLTLGELARLRFERGDSREASALLQRQSQAMAADPQVRETEVLTLQEHIAQIQLIAQGDAKAALAILDPLVARFDAVLGAEHDLSLSAHALAALADLSAGRWQRARDLLDADEAAVERRGASTIDPVIVAKSLQIRAKLALYRDAPAQALRALQGIPADIQVADPWSKWLVGEALLQDHQFAAAQDALEEASRAQKEKADAGKPTPMAGSLEDSLGRCAVMRGDAAAARPRFERAAEAFASSYGADNPSTLRSAFHARWAEALASGEPAALERLRGERARLAQVLGDENALQVRQADLLIDDLARRLGRPGIGAAARAQAESALAAVSARPGPPGYVGLTSFY